MDLNSSSLLNHEILGCLNIHRNHSGTSYNQNTKPLSLIKKNSREERDKVRNSSEGILGVLAKKVEL